MLKIILDYKSQLRLNWPKKATDVLALGQAYVAKEGSLAAGEQLVLPSLAQVTTQVTALQTAITAFSTAKVGKVVASEDRQQALREARPLMEQARDMLKVYYSNNLRQLGEWGFETRQREEDISVLLPYGDNELATVLNAYVTREQSLLETDRLPRPDLNQMIALNNIIQGQGETSRTQFAHRQAYREERDRVAAQLLLTLQVALVNLVYLNGGMLDNKFEEWGYPIVAINQTKPVAGGEKAVTSS